MNLSLRKRSQENVDDPYVLMIRILGRGGERLPFLEAAEEEYDIEQEIFTEFVGYVDGTEETAVGHRFRFADWNVWQTAKGLAKGLIRHSDLDGVVFAGIVDNYFFDDHNPYRMDFSVVGAEEWYSTGESPGYYPEVPEIEVEEE